jgi:DNA-binding CsgD family transcriptional regulator
VSGEAVDPNRKQEGLRSFMHEELLDRIYEASVIPELWVNVLDRMAPIVDCDGGLLFVMDSRSQVRFISSDCYKPLMNAFVNEGWMTRNIRAARLAAMNYPGFVTDSDVVTEEEINTDPLYVDFLRKHGGGYGAGSVISVPSKEILVFDFERHWQAGPLDRAGISTLDRLRPHLARSALISTRLGLERARVMAETLNDLGLPGAVLRSDGRVLASNGLFETLNRQFVALAGGGVAIKHAPAQKLLVSALTAELQTTRDSSNCSILIPADEDHSPCIAHLVPVKRQARDIFSGATFLLIVTPLALPQAPSSEILNGLFDLSPAEARTARGLVEGKSIAEVALANGLSRETIRTQLKSVLSKTGMRRQSELAGLFAGIRRFV